ncbi:MAG: Late competence development protein ComFB [Bacillales bacterium]|nr:Late competence development protein ComFB [Bacillales bacterium]
MTTKNVVELIVRDYIKENKQIIDQLSGSNINIDDVIAIVLNKIKPRYVTKESGEAFVKAEYFNQQNQVDTLKVILEAIEQVKQNPKR